jgi:hypothetical protein
VHLPAFRPKLGPFDVEKEPRVADLDSHLEAPLSCDRVLAQALDSRGVEATCKRSRLGNARESFFTPNQDGRKKGDDDGKKGKGRGL